MPSESEEFLGLPENKDHNVPLSRESFVSLKARILTLLYILMAGLVMCLNGAGAIFFYPLGLAFGFAHLFFTVFGIKMGDPLNLGGLILGYVLYLILFFISLVAPSRVFYRIMTGIMVFFTILNVVGCQMIIHIRL
jgi:hypothetical protein